MNSLLKSSKNGKLSQFCIIPNEIFLAFGKKPFEDVILG